MRALTESTGHRTRRRGGPATSTSECVRHTPAFAVSVMNGDAVHGVGRAAAVRAWDVGEAVRTALSPRSPRRFPMRVSRHVALSSALLLAIVSVDCAAQVSRIAFSRSGTNSETLFRINADGTGFMQLQPYTTNVYRGGAVFSPHGTYIAYTRAAA